MALRPLVIVDVGTGEVKVACPGQVLVSNGIGSCIAIAVLDPISGVGGIAHTMLPGRASVNREADKLRYAEDAYQELMKQFAQAGGTPERARFCIVGGGNVLHRDDDTICADNKRSIETIVRNHGLNVVVRRLGGDIRRTARIDLAQRRVFVSEGDAHELCVYEHEKEK